MEIDSGEIHLWCSFCGEITDETLLREYRRLLNDEETRRESQLHFPRDRHRYLVTRALTRVVLSRYAPISPEDWRFCTNRHGRPCVANENGRAIGLSFNITHTNGLIMCGVTKGGALGIDAEYVPVSRGHVDIANRFFMADEAAQIRGLPQDRQRQRFLEYWTLKECYVKALGTGLSMPLDRFGFRFPRECEIEFVSNSGAEVDPSRWRFWQFHPAADYLAAVCMERVRPEAPRLVLKRIVPLESERELEYRCWRVGPLHHRSAIDARLRISGPGLSVQRHGAASVRGSTRVP